MSTESSERAPKPAANGGSTYDAFISYSHAADGQLAPALRNGLQRFATSWRVFRWRNPVRALRIFQDQASLSANPALWPTIESALGSSEWFILLASPEAANSPWVEKEIDFWRHNKPVERLLIVQTDGEIAWEHDKNDFDWTRTTALPQRLTAVFPEEPRWIDARWARTSAQASVRDPRFRDLVAEAAAPLRGVPKDELIGEDIRQHRQLNRWRNAALGVVTMLLIGAVGAAAIAVQQRQVAIAQRDQAQRNQSRSLAAFAMTEAAAGSPATALRMALAGMPQSLTKPERAHAQEAEGALWSGLEALRELRRIRHHDSVRAVAFSPDGRTLATGGHDGMARLWEVATAKQVRAFRGHEKEVTSVAFSPDGKFLATGSHDGTARLWEVARGEEVRAFRGHKGGVISTSLSPDGRTLATASLDNTTRLWDVTTGSEIRALQAVGVSAVAFSPDGLKLATGSVVGTARLWVVATGQQIIALDGLSGSIESVAFSPDGTRLATVSSETINLSSEHGGIYTGRPEYAKARLWNFAIGKETLNFRGHDSHILAVAFSPDGTRLATGSSDKTAKLWDAYTGKEIAVFRGYDGAVTSVAFSPDGRMIAAGSYDGTARLWDVADTVKTVIPWDLSTSGSGSDEHVSKVITDHVRKVITDKATAILHRHPGSVDSIAFSPDGMRLAAVSNGTGWLWNVAMGQNVIAFPVHNGEMSGGQVTWQPRWEVAFSPDGRMLATGSSDKTARLWHAATGNEISAFIGHENGVTAVAFSPDGRTLATGSDDNTARLWELAFAKELGVLRGHESPVSSVAFSPDGRTLATGSTDKTARLWDVAQVREDRAFRGHKERVTAVAFSPDGRTLATGSIDKTTRLWDVAVGKEVRAFRGHEGPIFSVAFSRDGQMLATGSFDGTVRLWEFATGKEIATLRGHKSSVKSVAFSPDGRVFATGSEDGTVRLWLVGQGVIDLACARVHFLPLSERDKQSFGIEDEWCTPEVSGALRAKLGLDKPEESVAGGATAR